VIARLATFSVDHRLGIVIVTLLAAVLALFPALGLPLDALPDLTNNQVLVLTRAPGFSPEEVELTVSRPIEVALSGLPGLVEQRSLSRYGISAVTAVFDDDVDAWRARQMVAERTALADLPEAAEAPELGPLTGGLGEIFHLTLSSDRRTRTELLELATFRVSPLLKGVPGVVEVNSWGGAVRTLDVVAQPALMAARGVTLSALADAVSQQNGAAAGGALNAGKGQVLLRGQARPRAASELAAVAISEPLVRVSDIAEVREGTALRLGAATLNGRGETVYLMAQMLRDENALEVLDRIHARMAEVKAALPSDVHIDVIYDRSVLVGGTLRTVATNLLEGGGLVVFVLLAFLGSVRAGLIAASVIPLSMIFATAVMALFRLPGNLMSLGALDFGLLVDGAIVFVEGVFHAPPSEDRESWTDHVREIVARAARPVFFSVLVILLVYIPVLSLTGTDGKLFRPMAITVVLALCAALFLSMTWVPAMLALALRSEHVPSRPPWAVRLLDRTYPAIIERIIGRRIPVALFALSLLIVGVLAARTLGVEFTPQLDEGDLVVQTTRAPDISLDGSVAEALHLERVLLQNFPEVRSVVSRIGSPAVATDIMGFDQADVFVGLAPRATWREGLTRDALVADMQRVIERDAPGGDPGFTQPIQMRFNELLGGAVTDVAVSVFGDDLLELRRLADALANTFETVRGAEDVRVLAPPSVPMLTVRPRPIESAQLGLRARDVLDAVQSVQMGLPVGQTWDSAVRIPLRVLLDTSQAANDLMRLSIPLASGGVVPLSRVAEVVEESGPGLVNRQNGQRRVVIGFNVRGADLGTVVHDAQAAAKKNVPLPNGYRLEWGGQYESLTAAARRLSLVVPIVLLMIIAVLAITFRRLRSALSVFTVVPIAAVGGVITLWLRDMPLSLPSAIGFIALSGIAVMNGVVWMARALEIEAEVQDPVAIARGAALERARPVLMTALVAALGFVPMMLSTGVGAEVQRPLATVVVGGLVTSTVLTLIVLPVLYPWLRGRRRGGGQ
jgi:cobalt-zinc-cadmium resistance protein CzcA